MAELGTDWTRSAGDFSCVVCERKQLPASEFSKKQVEKALQSLKTLPNRDIRSGPDITRTIFLQAVCKKCTEEGEEAQRLEAKARREECEAHEEAAAQAMANLEPGPLTLVILEERPFGMSSSKSEDDGYVVGRVTDGKPAAKAGVGLGWRVTAVADSSCRGLNLENVQQLLRTAPLPVTVEFEQLPNTTGFCTACQRVLTTMLFSRKMLTKPVEKRRCSACVEESLAGPGVDAGEEKAAGGADALSDLQALCADSAKQAEKVTGLKPVRGGGRGRGRGRR